jgi:hypothetical protein
MINSPQEDSSPEAGDHPGPAEVDSNPGPVVAAGHSSHHHRTGCWEEDRRNAT